LSFFPALLGALLSYQIHPHLSTPFYSLLTLYLHAHRLIGVIIHYPPHIAFSAMNFCPIWSLMEIYRFCSTF
ncbi:MAG: hypothetical protein P4M02_04015, partial [Clostridia bacterium]|nr:hypothetical protein [Clostridia bacterium]